MLEMVLLRGFVLQDAEAMMYLALEGCLCILDIHYMYGRHFCTSLTVRLYLSQRRRLLSIIEVLSAEVKW